MKKSRSSKTCLVGDYSIKSISKFNKIFEQISPLIDNNSFFYQIVIYSILKACDFQRVINRMKFLKNPLHLCQNPHSNL